MALVFNPALCKKKKLLQRTKPVSPRCARSPQRKLASGGDDDESDPVSVGGGGGGDDGGVDGCVCFLPRRLDSDVWPDGVERLNNTLLFLRPLQRNDSGVYRCEVANSIDLRSRDLRILIQGESTPHQTTPAHGPPPRCSVQNIHNMGKAGTCIYYYGRKNTCVIMCWHGFREGDVIGFVFRGAGG